MHFNTVFSLSHVYRPNVAVLFTTHFIIDGYPKIWYSIYWFWFCGDNEFENSLRHVSSELKLKRKLYSPCRFSTFRPGRNTGQFFSELRESPGKLKKHLSVARQEQTSRYRHCFAANLTTECLKSHRGFGYNKIKDKTTFVHSFLKTYRTSANYVLNEAVYNHYLQTV